MYTIIETDKVSDYPDKLVLSFSKDCILSLHIMVDPLLDISKVELYRCLSDVVECSNRIQIYLYTQPDRPWIKELDILVDSVFKPYHNINLVLLRDDKPIKDISNFINFKTGTILAQDFSMISTTDGILILDRLIATSLLNGYDVNTNTPITLTPSDYVLYGGEKPYSVLGKAINKLLNRQISRVSSQLNLKILYVEQAERESTDNMINHYRTRDNTILSSFNKILHTSVDFYSIFTESDTIENLIKTNSKDKSKDTILIVIDSIDRSGSVNSNNNSYYISIDTYITHSILRKIIDIILKNIYK